MKRFIAAIIVLAVSILSTGCMGSAALQPEDAKIAALENVKPEDIQQIVIETGDSSETLTDAYDIGICLVDLQSVRLTEQMDETVEEWYRAFRLLLTSGETVEIRFGSGIIWIGDRSYRYDASESPITRGSVRLLTQDKAYEPYAWWVFSQDFNGSFADGMWFGLQAVDEGQDVRSELDRLDDIPYSDDLVFECVWDYDHEKTVEPTYSVFDKDLNRISHYMPELDIPNDAGIYYVAVNVGWGTGYRYEGYNYIFKIIKE